MNGNIEHNHLFHNFNCLAKAKVSRPSVRQVSSFYPFPSLHLPEGSDEEHIAIKFQDTAKNGTKSRVTEADGKCIPVWKQHIKTVHFTHTFLGYFLFHFPFFFPSRRYFQAM